MKRAINFILLPTLIITALSAYALPPVHYTPAADREYDFDTYFDANNILMTATNIGSIAMDIDNVFGNYFGFYYPYTGDINDYLDGDNKQGVVFAAGLTLGGKVGNELRTATVFFDNCEYAPGPMSGGTSQPDQVTFRIYKIDGRSSVDDPDYAEWPVDDGALIDKNGLPLLFGDQTLWCVFNDAGPHDSYAHGGGTDPLGIEVHQTIWGSDVSGEEDILYLKYKLYNKGGNNIDSFYISLWIDPDIGWPTDDLVGCDTIHDIFFAYNGSATDNVYFDTPPACGGRVLFGPVVASPGNLAFFDNHLMRDYKNTGMSSFNKYINGTDPGTPEEVFMYMMGWDAMQAAPYINPETGEETSYYASGDPVTGDGWIDDHRTDCRMMASFGPLEFNAGDSQQVILKIGAAMADDNLSSVQKLKETLIANPVPARVSIYPRRICALTLLGSEPAEGYIYIKNFNWNARAGYMYRDSFIINGDIVPSEVKIFEAETEITEDSVIHTGQDFLRLSFPIKDFVESYSSLYGVTNREFTVAGRLKYGPAFEIKGEFELVGQYYVGDVNSDGAITMTDILYLANYLYRGGPEPEIPEAADVNGTDDINILDIVYLINYLYKGGPVPISK